MKAEFRKHFEEARSRLSKILLFFLFCTLLSYPLAKPVMQAVKDDMLSGVELVVIEPQEAIIAYIWASLLMGVLLTVPFMTYHLWVFMAPGLKKSEKNLILRLFVPAVFLFGLGCAFGYFVLMPVSLKFLISQATPLATPMLSLYSTFSFITYLLILLGLMFEFPLISYGLSRAGFLSHETMRQYRRHAIVASFLFAAVVTDPSPVTQVILAAPMVALYEVGVLTAKIGGGGR